MRRLGQVTAMFLVLGVTAGCSPAADDATVGTSTSALRAPPPPSDARAFTEFESGQVRPLALSANGKFLYAVNTPDNRLEIFRVDDGRLSAVMSVPVGLEPVAVAERCDGEVWVVNHLSDSVSIVDVRSLKDARVVRTLLVGDEPRDIVFAGANRSRAFVTTAHRGQNTGQDPQLTTPGIGRADVWVFDANHLGQSLAGDPLDVITLFSDTPRALAVTPDGRTVYAAAFESGNRTTSVFERVVSFNGGLPAPHTNSEGAPQPPTGLVVQYRRDAVDGQLHWLDNVGRRWDDQVKFSLPDKDVFTIDAMANPPAAIDDKAYAGVGTILFNMAVNPANGKIYVANTEALNQVRFEGHDQFGPTTGAPPGSVRGHIAENRITVLDPRTGGVTPRHLNKHIDYTREGTPDEVKKSLAFPTGMAISSDGSMLYVAALGSSKVGIYATRALENDSFVPSQANQVTVSGGGPTGLVLDESHGKLFVMTRFDNAISVVDVQKRKETAHVSMWNPEPVSIVQGRRFLYDAAFTSGHGDSACATCHVFGDFDSLAWDLGDPDDIVTPVPGPFTIDPALIAAVTGGAPVVAHPLKGPMTTQSLRGMANHGPMHWRGDRTGGTDATRLNIVASAQPDTGTFDETIAFGKFNVAFDGLLGRGSLLTAAEMKAFTDFILQVAYPPNPIRNLDDSLTADQQAGRDFFFSRTADGQELPSDRFHNCVSCHVLDPAGNGAFGVQKPGFFGSDGRYSFEAETQFFKVPHLRNLYQKVGMFGMPLSFDPNDTTRIFRFLPPPYNDNSFMGDQVRGFGFLHDGSADTVFRFHGATLFAQGPAVPPALPPNPGGFPLITDPARAAEQLAANFKARRQVEAFVLAFDSNLAPIIGQQATLGPASGDDVGARVALFEERASAGECELVVKGNWSGRPFGYLYRPESKNFLSDRARGATLSDGAIRALGAVTELTFTAVPPGSGVRMALDRRGSGVLDGDDTTYEAAGASAD
jgi:DNA-binding beta-propeller fold protein YncE